jgi:uncharacterized protein (DUF2164 family)
MYAASPPPRAGVVYIMPINFSPDTTRQLHASIKRYFAETLEQEVGELQAGLLLDYVLKEIGPTVYNKAIADAQAYFQGRVADLEGVCYEREFTYWEPPRGGSTPTKRAKP